MIAFNCAKGSFDEHGEGILPELCGEAGGKHVHGGDHRFAGAQHDECLIGVDSWSDGLMDS